MSTGTLYDHVFDMHHVRRLPSGRDQLLVRLHLVNEVTSPQAFEALDARGLPVAHPGRTLAAVDHMVPTSGDFTPQGRRLHDILVANARRHGIPLSRPGERGILHVIAPELGMVHPGMTVCVGDSHATTHGALGAVGMGIGTTQVRDVLATQTTVVDRLRVRRIEIDGALGKGVEAKDVILTVIRRTGVRGGVGHAYELAGSTVEAMSVEQRMTLCNMAIEGGATVAYVVPDDVTFDYLRGRPYAPVDDEWTAATAAWRSFASRSDATYDDVVKIDACGVEPMVTWGIHPGQSVGVKEAVPRLDEMAAGDRAAAELALGHMGVAPGRPLLGLPIDVAFVGSCANGRYADIAAVGDVVAAVGGRVAPGVRALVVPGSEPVEQALRRDGVLDVLGGAGFEIGQPGCSLCVGMNGDPLVDDQVCVSTSTRNFRGRQGSARGRTLLMSPAMVAGAALAGEVVDVRELVGAAP